MFSLVSCKGKKVNHSDPVIAATLHHPVIYYHPKFGVPASNK